MLRFVLRSAGLVLAVAVLAAGCEEDTDTDDGTPENAGHPCNSASDCYPGIDQQALEGDVVCIDSVPNGYCTHLCQDDNDCCTVPGECETGHPQVCSPFTSHPATYCLLSCEDDEVGSLEPSAYCQRFADVSFGCRSSGGGSDNRKVCMP